MVVLEGAESIAAAVEDIVVAIGVGWVLCKIPAGRAGLELASVLASGPEMESHSVGSWGLCRWRPEHLRSVARS